MKNEIKLLIPCLILSSSLEALVRLGEGTIDLVMDASVYYDSEINARDEGRDDIIFTAAPSLQYSRDSRTLGITASAGVSFIKYVDNDEFDDENFFFDFSMTPGVQMETSRFSVSGDLLFSNETRSEESVGDIVTIRNYGASGSVTYRPNSKYSVVGSASFSREEPQSSVYPEKDRVGAGLTLLVPINKTTDAQAGVSYQKTDSETSISDNETYTYFVGLSGNLLPKVSGNVSVGMQQQKLDSGGDEKSPFLSAGLDWLASERTKVTLDASQSLGTTIDDRTSESLSVTLTASHALTRDWSTNGYVGYNEDDYSGAAPIDNRTDEEFFIGVGTSYQIIEWGSLGFDVRYSDQTSSQAAFEYDRLRAGISFRGQW